MLELSGGSASPSASPPACSSCPCWLLSAYGGLIADRFDKRLHPQDHPGLAGALRGGARPAGDHRGRDHLARLPARPALRRRHRLRQPGPAVLRLRARRAGAPAQRDRPQLGHLPRRPHRRSRRWPVCVIAGFGSGWAILSNAVTYLGLHRRPAAARRPPADRSAARRPGPSARSARGWPTSGRHARSCSCSAWCSSSAPSG